jgi:superfamily I DNA/RNA helicase
VAGDIPWTW